MQIITIGLDIAKNVFQVHGIDGAEMVIVRKQLRRGQVMAFFEALARASSAWMPVPRRTIGRAS
jgi:transposase